MERLLKFCKDHWYTLKESIDFDTDRYKDWIPSVTTILQLIVDPWFEYIKKHKKEMLKKACDRWNKIHKDAEDFSNGKSLSQHPQITKFQVLHDITTVHAERKHIKDWIQWTIDAEVQVGPIEWLTNIDYKSSLHENAKYKIQLWWYHYLTWNSWMILHIWPDSYKLINSTVDDLLIFIELKDYFFTLLNQKNKWH